MNNFSLLLNAFIVIPIIAVIIFNVFFIIIIVSIIKTVIKRRKIFNNSSKDNTENENSINNFFEFVDSVNNCTCEYCGTKFSRKESKCPSCGAQKNN